MQIIISAGGGGTRLWPLSTPKRPKQFVNILDDASLLRQSFDNLTRKFDPNSIWITTNYKHKDIALKNLPKNFNPEHLIVEPTKRNTFAAIVAAASIVASKTSNDETLLFMVCDGYLPNDASKDNSNIAFQLIDETIQQKKFDFIATLIKPNYPATCYGYVEIEPEDHLICFEQAVSVKSFTQQPKEKIAKKFLASGNFFWNRSTPSFTYNSLITLLEKTDLDSANILKQIYQDQGYKPEIFNQLPIADFDVEVLCKSDRLGGLGLDILWDDIGTWVNVEKYLQKLSDNQTQISGTGNKVHLKDKKRKVAFVGVSNLLLVETDEGILVVDPRNTSEIRKVADYFEKK